MDESARPSIHKVGIHSDICMHLEPGKDSCLMSQAEALRLAKDLLNACAEPEPTIARVLTFDDEIIGNTLFEGRLFVFCKRSVWEIFVDSEDWLRQKQISCTADKPNDC